MERFSEVLSRSFYLPLKFMELGSKSKRHGYASGQIGAVGQFTLQDLRESGRPFSIIEDLKS